LEIDVDFCSTNTVISNCQSLFIGTNRIKRPADNTSVFQLENVLRRDNMGNPGLDGTIILKWILRNRVRGCGLDSSGSNRADRQALVNTVMNL
jgi:hypothetical protein